MVSQHDAEVADLADLFIGEDLIQFESTEIETPSPTTIAIDNQHHQLVRMAFFLNHFWNGQILAQPR